MSLGITGNIIASIIYDAANGTYKQFNTPLELAMQDTSNYFLKENGIELSSTQLRKILESTVSIEQFTNFENGIDFVKSDKLALQLATFSSLYLGDDESKIYPIAQQVMDYLILRFEYRLLENPKTAIRTILSYIKIYKGNESEQNIQIINKLSELKEKIELLLSTLSPVDSRIDELIMILQDRANIVVDLLSSIPSLKNNLDEFNELHTKHIECLAEGKLFYAHEIINKIYKVLYKIENNESWRDVHRHHNGLTYNSAIIKNGLAINTYLFGNHHKLTSKLNKFLESTKEIDEAYLVYLYILKSS